MRARAALLHQLLFGLALGDDEVIIVTVVTPRSRRNVAHFYKLPVGYVNRTEPEIITHRG